MYKDQELPVKPVLADVPIEMPVDILLALPKYVTSDLSISPFNLIAAVNSLLGHFGWERAVKILVVLLGS